MAQVPHERELHKRLQGKPFALLGVSCGDTLDVATETAKKHQTLCELFLRPQDAPAG